MLISPSTLLDQYRRASKTWPAIHKAEADHGLPRFLLFAVASVETNMRPVVGDGGHGHGMFQLDDRWHTIPAGFDKDVKAQAVTAAKMLKANLDHFHGQLHPAVAAYNCGVGNVESGIRNHGDPDYWTTHLGAAHVGYGAEVLARFQSLREQAGKPRRPLGRHARDEVKDLADRLDARAHDGQPTGSKGSRKGLRRLREAITRALKVGQ